MQIFKKNSKLKAFTFAELMISLVIITVITVVLYPTISDLAPNNNKALFKSTYKTIEMIISDIMLTSDMPNKTNTGNATRAASCLCNEFADRMNINTAVNAHCTDVGACPNGKSYNTGAGGNNTIITTNGVRWAFGPGDGTDYLEILIDVNASNNKLDPKDGSIIIVTNVNPAPATNDWKESSLSKIWKDAKDNSETARGIYYTNNSKTQDTFLIRVQAAGESRGKITIISSTGNQHLLDNE